MSSSRQVMKKRCWNGKEHYLRRQKSTRFNNASLRSRIDELGFVCKTRKKISPSREADGEEKECEIFEQLAEEGWPDADKCTRLSSGSSSPSSCYDDDDRLYTLSDINISRNPRLVFVLMLLANLSPNMSGVKRLPDVSILRPLIESSFVLQRNSLTQSEGGAKDDKKVTSPGGSTRSQLTSSSVSSPGSAESFTGLASDNYSIFSNPSSVGGRGSDPRVLDSDKIGISEPLVDLEEEISNLNSDVELDVDFIPSDFPGPSSKNSMASNVQTSNSSITQDTEAGHGGTGSFSSTDDLRSDALSLDDCDADEPIFWPSGLKFAWGSEAAEDCFVMSPPKKKFKPEAASEITEEKKRYDADLSKVETVNLDDVNADEPLVWPSGQKFDWSSSGAVENIFTMSPSKKKCKKVVKFDKDIMMDAWEAEAVNLEDFRPDEPLIWPSDQKFDWSSDGEWNFFNISPSKNKSKVVRFQNKLSSIKVDKSSMLDASGAEAVNLKDINSDEPLLWPSDQKFDWNSETAFNFFIMSPLKKKHGATNFDNTSPSMKADEDFLVHFSGDEPLVWPSDQEFDWDSDAARNYFIISPRKKKIFELVTSQIDSGEIELKTGRKRNRAISPGIPSSKIFELRCANDSRGVSRTKSVPTKLNEYQRFFRKDGV